LSIWVAGEVLIDILPTGDVVGGGSANTAKALARLGHSVDFIDGISNDRYGLMARKALARDGVGLAHSLNSDKPTCTATVTVDPHGVASYEFLIDKTATFDFESSWLPDPSIHKPSVLHIGTLATIIEPGANELFDWALHVGEFAPIIFDPNIRPSVMGDREIYSSSVEKWSAISSIVKVSDEDLKWLYPDETMDEVAHRWMAQGVSCVVITRGVHGLIGFSEHGMEEVDGAKVTVIDTVGAGDTVGAIIVEGVIEHSVAGLQGQILNSVLHKAAIAAGITCSRAGAQPPYKHELTEAMENNAVY
jgi:fructokinase